MRLIFRDGYWRVLDRLRRELFKSTTHAEAVAWIKEHSGR